jgi:hypothetical protein
MADQLLQYPEGTPQWHALEHAVRRYGDRLHVEPRRATVTTLQGGQETGWIVYGRAHGGDDVGIVFPGPRQDAQDAIDAVNQAVADRDPRSRLFRRMFSLHKKPVNQLNARDLRAIAGDRWQSPIVAYYIDIVGYGRAEALYSPDDGRLGIAWGADADWGDVNDALDIGPAIDDWLNDLEAWEARN